MRIDYLKIKNFKCFDEFEIRLSPHQNVHIIFGVNGTGKTSILEALGLAAGTFFMKLPEVENRNLDKEEVRLKPVLGKLEYQFPVELEARGNTLSKDWNIKRTATTLIGGLGEIEAKELVSLSREAARIVQEGGEMDLPVVSYFSCRRLFNDRKKASKKPIGRLLGTFNALNDSSIKKELDEWFWDKTVEQSVQIASGKKDFIHPELGLIYNLLLSVFPGKYNRIYTLQPSLDDRLQSGLFFEDDESNVVTLAMMSDGYRNLYYMVIDIAWRCLQLNSFLKEEVFQKSRGLVLIDEIDLHLHPELQLQVIDILTRLFPKFQFVVSTHSPLVLGSSKAEILKFENGKLNPQEPLFGQDASYIIRHSMDAEDRNNASKKDIEVYFNLINQGSGKTREALILREKVKKYDPNLIAEADVLMKFMEE